MKRKTKAKTQQAEFDLRYRTLFERGPYGVLLIDLETAHAVDFNDQAASQLGYTREEFAVLGIQDYEDIETAEETAKHVQKVLVVPAQHSHAAELHRHEGVKHHAQEERSDTEHKQNQEKASKDGIGASDDGDAHEDHQ